MSFRLTRKPKARRALRDENRTATGLMTGGLAAMAVAALVAAGVSADSPARAAEASHAPALSQALHNHSHAHGAATEPNSITDAHNHVAALSYADEATLQREYAVLASERTEETLTVMEEEPVNVAAAPVAPEAYSLGARWGATGAWSRYHTGQDLSAPVGTPVYAVAPGVVGESNAGGWAGVHAVIKHSDGSSLYAHLNNLTVKPGQEVKAGDQIGTVGMTGRTFGAHLHFEFYPDGAATNDPYSTKDPYAWLEAKGVRM
ncbi:M23 family metallopeptidase [Ammonicoccus fulvus]|uniref:M23 family metallopeptidase n=1 Tax=Ammonicoccus fulvus TaxID=3138240 RepID=A0ABZ3FJ22_9ACTN